jgi:membrane protease YdiL (CAAX protease family)
MRSNLKISSPRSQLGLFLALLGGAWLFANILGGMILLSTGPVTPGQTTLSLGNASIGVLKFIQAFSTVLSFLLPAVLFAFYTFRHQQFYLLGFRPPEKAIFYLLAIALILFASPLEWWLGQLNRAVPLADWMMRTEKEAARQITLFLKAGSMMDVVVNIFIIALLPAVCEEACFRGALQRILIHYFKSPWAGIIVTAIFFSAFHMQFQGFLPRMFLGVLLGALYWYSGSLWVSILAHFFTNGIQVLAVSFHPELITEDPSVPLYSALISMVIIVGLLIVMRKQSTMSYEKNYEEEERIG